MVFLIMLLYIFATISVAANWAFATMYLFTGKDSSSTFVRYLHRWPGTVALGMNSSVADWITVCYDLQYFSLLTWTNPSPCKDLALLDYLVPPLVSCYFANSTFSGSGRYDVETAFPYSIINLPSQPVGVLHLYSTYVIQLSLVARHRKSTGQWCTFPVLWGLRFCATH